MKAVAQIIWEESVMRKKLYKAKKNWVIGTIVAMTITLGTSFVMTTSIHADVNQQVVIDNNTRNTLVSSQQSTTNTSYGNSVNQESITGRIKDVPDQNTNGQQTVQQQNEEDATQSNVSQKQAAVPFAQSDLQAAQYSSGQTVAEQKESIYVSPEWI